MQTLKIAIPLKYSISRCDASLLHNQNYIKTAKNIRKYLFQNSPPHKKRLNLLKIKGQKSYVFTNKAQCVNKDKGTMRRTFPSKLCFLRDKACYKRIHTNRLFLIHQNKIHYTIPSKDITI